MKILIVAIDPHNPSWRMKQLAEAARGCGHEVVIRSPEENGDCPGTLPSFGWIDEAAELLPDVSGHDLKIGT